MNMQMNLQVNKNMQYHYGSDGVQLEELHGRMSIHYPIMIKPQEQITLDQEIEFCQSSNMLIIESSLVLILLPKLMMLSLKFSLKPQFQLLTKLHGFMLIMHTAEKHNLLYIS